MTAKEQHCLVKVQAKELNIISKHHAYTVYAKHKLTKSRVITNHNLMINIKAKNAVEKFSDVSGFFLFDPERRRKRFWLDNVHFVQAFLKTKKDHPNNIIVNYV